MVIMDATRELGRELVGIETLEHDIQKDIKRATG